MCNFKIKLKIIMRSKVTVQVRVKLRLNVRCQLKVSEVPLHPLHYLEGNLLGALLDVKSKTGGIVGVELVPGGSRGR